jgi:hypothetical protein
MKKTKRGGQPFMVPLTDAMLAVLSALPRFDGGDYLFSHHGGQGPVKPNHFSDVKERLDAIILEELKQVATDAGKDASESPCPVL